MSDRHSPTNAKSAAPDQENALSTSNHTDHIAEKAFSTMQARFALLRHCLYRASGANGATVFLVTRWGMVRELKTLEAVAAFFALIGGKA